MRNVCGREELLRTFGTELVAPKIKTIHSCYAFNKCKTTMLPLSIKFLKQVGFTTVLVVFYILLLTRYSLLNSCSANESLLNSQLNSNAVSIGSLLDNAMSDGLKLIKPLLNFNNF